MAPYSKEIGRLAFYNSPIGRTVQTIWRLEQVRTGRPAGTTRLVRQAQNTVLNGLRYFARQGTTEHIKDIGRKTSEAIKISLSMVTTIRKEGQEE